MLFALGHGDDIVAVSHACDFPVSAQDLPRVTYPVLPEGLEAAEIDDAVRALTEAGRGLYGLDGDRLRALAPELIVTRGSMTAAGVSEEELQALLTRMDPRPEVIILDPTTIGEVLGDVRTLASATDSKDAAVDLIRDAADRIDRVRVTARGARRVRVAALEWLDPIRAAGLWTPQLIEYAGGDDVLGFAGEQSEPTSWDELTAMQPEVVVVMLRDSDAEQGLDEAEAFADELAATGARRVVAVDSAALFSRPGARLVSGLELVAHVLHPDRFPDAAAPVLEVLL